MVTLTLLEKAHCATMSESRAAAFIAKTGRMSAFERDKQRVLLEVLRAIDISKAGGYHPRLLTPSRKLTLKEADRLRRISKRTAFFPLVPQIIVTEKMETFYDYKDRRGGMGWSERQE